MDDQSLNLAIKNMIQEKASQVELRLVSIEKDLESLREFKSETKTDINESCDRIDEIENSIKEGIGQINQIKSHLAEVEEKKNSIMSNWIAPLIIGLIIAFASVIPSCIYIGNVNNNEPSYPPRTGKQQMIDHTQPNNQIASYDTTLGGNER